MDNTLRYTVFSTLCVLLWTILWGILCGVHTLYYCGQYFEVYYVQHTVCTTVDNTLWYIVCSTLCVLLWTIFWSRLCRLQCQCFRNYTQFTDGDNIWRYSLCATLDNTLRYIVCTTVENTWKYSLCTTKDNTLRHIVCRKLCATLWTVLRTILWTLQLPTFWGLLCTLCGQYCNIYSVSCYAVLFTTLNFLCDLLHQTWTKIFWMWQPP